MFVFKRFVTNPLYFFHYKSTIQKNPIEFRHLNFLIFHFDLCQKFPDSKNLILLQHTHSRHDSNSSASIAHYRTLEPNSSPTNACIHVQVCGSKRFGCYAGHQEVSMCHTRDESKEPIACIQQSIQVRDPPCLGYIM